MAANYHVPFQTGRTYKVCRFDGCCKSVGGLNAGWLHISRYFKYVRQQMLDNMGWQTDSRQFPLPLPRLVTLLRAAVPEDGIVCLDNGCVERTGAICCVSSEAVNQLANRYTAKYSVLCVHTPSRVIHDYASFFGLYAPP